MRELTEHEVEMVAGGATAEIFRQVAQAALAGAATGATKPVTLEMGPVEVKTLYGPPTPIK